MTKDQIVRRLAQLNEEQNTLLGLLMLDSQLAPVEKQVNNTSQLFREQLNKVREILEDRGVMVSGTSQIS
jgi:hypothetical protein